MDNLGAYYAKVDMDKKVKELIEATGAWVAICIKGYPNSMAVDDKLVRVCAALSAFGNNEMGKVDAT